MATSKRDRQRVNRAEKQAAEQKKQRRRDAFNIIKRWTLIGLGIAAVMLVASFFLN